MTTASQPAVDTAGLFQALGDETRLAILERLANGERCVCDLQDALDSYQSRLSFHLRKLRDAGIVEDRREGRWVYYSLNPEAFARMKELVGKLETAAREAPGGCC